MAAASYEITSFLGGEVSKLYQGRYDRPDYRTFLNISFNGHPVEEGAWVRRPGTQFAGTTRGGVAGRVARFDFEAAAPATLEFTDGWLRFRHGVTWATTNDAVAVLAISGANPAVLQTAAAVTWSTGNTVTLADLGATAPVLQNRQLVVTKIDTTHFSLKDAITGVAINGATLGSISNAAMVSRIQEVVSPYVAGAWANVRIVQAETSGVMLTTATAPQLLQVTTLPTTALDAQFSLAPLVFIDGPYLDPPTNGVQVVPSATSGSLTLTVSFPAYSSSQAYAKGAFVTASSVNYVSLIDANVGNTPASSPAAWATTSVAAAINGGQGFSGGDVGRLVRLLSEPPVWVAGTTYSAGQFVTYNPSGVPGASTYWTAQASTTGNIPGNDLTHWELTPSNVAIWSWGKITALTNQISQTLSGSLNIGNMSSGGGVAAAFDGNATKATPASASLNNSGGSGAGAAIDCFVGKNYSGASAQAIYEAVLYPPTDQGFATASYTPPGGGSGSVQGVPMLITLRAKSTAPSAPSDGTILGQASFFTNGPQNTSALVIPSNDTVSTWNYVWVEITCSLPGFLSDFASVQGVFAQVYFFSPPGTGTTTGVQMELLGPPLLYTGTISTWRLGVYSVTTGFPTCGAYHEGRLWLGGAVANRFDASVSNGLSGSTINFAPTDYTGVVADSNAISEVMNSDGVNPLLWMKSDQQGVLCGTLKSGWLIAPPGQGAMTPTNIAARPLAIEGSAAVEPYRTGHTLCYVQRFGRKLMELFADVYSGKLTAPNLAEKAMHIPKPGIAEIAYTSAVTPIIWGRNTDGSWWGITYKRDVLSTQAEPKFAGWHRHALGSGRTVTSICAGPSTDGTLDALTMVTTDGTTYHVEILTDTLPEGAALTDAAYCDDAVTASSTVSSNTPVAGAPYGGLTLNGLWHLNGKTVTAWLGGLDCGDYTVANGSITVPYGDSVSAGTGTGLFTAAYVQSFTGAMPMVVGFTFTSQGQATRPNSPAESGARNGPALGKKRRTHEYAAQLEGAGFDGGKRGSIMFGTDQNFAKLHPALFRQPNDSPYTVQQQFDGIYANTIRDVVTLGYDSMMCWKITRPYPANLVALAAFIATEDK